MFLNKQKIYLVIFLGFFISLITSSNYLNSYDKYSSKYNSHSMIKESIGGDWNKAQEIPNSPRKNFPKYDPNLAKNCEVVARG